jgi:poly [ADP-ribose] polymerase
MFQFTDLHSNHNKFYFVEIWPAGGDTVRFKASWGRVGSKPQVCEKVARTHELDRLIGEKLRKGYRPVDLHRPAVEVVEATRPEANPVRLDPKVAQLVDWVFMEAGEQIRSYLAVSVETLSQAQIEEGRRLLAEAQERFAGYTRRTTPGNLDTLAATVQGYYNTIPTKLPARPEREQLVRDFCKQFGEQENRLLQLEAAVATSAVRRLDPGMSLYQSLGAEVALLPPDDPAHAALVGYIERTQVHGYKMQPRDIFSVRIPAEREAYERNRRGVSRKELLFHGTRNGNVRHILRQGLICPGTPSHGRMLGNGIYLANMASKSANYCAPGRRDVPRMLLVVEAALGKCYCAPQAGAFDRPPLRHDSVRGKAGQTRIGLGGWTLMNDEFVVFSPSQQTIRYLVTFDV